MWDFGDAFGNDQYTCESEDHTKSTLGCKAKVSAGESGVAIATSVIDTYAPWHHNSRSDVATLAYSAEIARNLKSTTNKVSEELITV